MKKESSGHIRADVLSNAQTIKKEHLSNANKIMTERILITQELIKALQKKLTIQSYLLDKSLGSTGL